MILRNHNIEQALHDFPIISEELRRALQAPISPFLGARAEEDFAAFDDDDPEAFVDDDDEEEKHDLELTPQSIPTTILSATSALLNSLGDEGDSISEADFIGPEEVLSLEDNDEAPDYILEVDSGDEIPSVKFPDPTPMLDESFFSEKEPLVPADWNLELKAPSEDITLKDDDDNVNDVRSACETRKVYCTCQQEDDGKLMIECSNRSQCIHPQAQGWYHEACLSVDESSSLKAAGLKKAWYCNTCSEAKFILPKKRKNLLNKDPAPNVIIKGPYLKRKIQRKNAVREP